MRYAAPLLILMSMLSGAAHAEVKPSVLLISIDDLNDWIGCLKGHPQALTPNIDRLAARGVLFTNAHCAAPACNPSRAAVFSGQMPWKTGVWSNDSRKLLAQKPDIHALPRAFQKAGYMTLGTGKLLHGGASNAYLYERHFNPEQRWSPLDGQVVKYTSAELPSKGTEHPRHLVTMKDGQEIVLPLNRMPSDRKPDSNGGESFDWGPFDVQDAAMGDAQIASWAVKQLDAGFRKPFFMAVGFYRPHIPLWAPKAWFQRFEGISIQLPLTRGDDLSDLSDIGREWATRAVTAGAHATVVRRKEWEQAVKAYLACVTFVDHQVGRLLDAVDDSSAAENTVIVLWSDHGWHLGEKQHWGKWTGWERSTRVPLIIATPGAAARQRVRDSSLVRCDAPVSLVDLYRTLGELCDIPVPADLDGVSLGRLLRNPAASNGRVVSTIFDRGNVSLRSDRFRFIRYADGSEELYDLRSDPNEWSNIVQVKRFEGIARSLRTQASRVAAR